MITILCSCTECVSIGTLVLVNPTFEGLSAYLSNLLLITVVSIITVVACLCVLLVYEVLSY
jgi:hypothetical protein